MRMKRGCGGFGRCLAGIDILNARSTPSLRYCGERVGERVGVVRARVALERTMPLSLALSPAYRGEGSGAQIKKEA
jgi:hypothetical protein